MDEVTSKGEWSPDDQKQLLNSILSLGGTSSKRSYKAVESSLKWEDIKVDGKTAEECKAMYQKLISKVRKFRTVQEIIGDAFELITVGNVKGALNELPDMPKKPLTAFSLFIRKKSKKFPEIKGTNRLKVFAKDWNELSETKKEVYKNKYLKLKKKYEEDLDIFRQNHPEYQNASNASSSRPQPPLPSKLFVESRLEKLKSKHPELSHTDAVKKLTDKYKKLSDKKKLKWINKAKDCAQTYQNQCEQYLANHPKSIAKPGVFHLSKEEQRIWHSSKGKPLPAPQKNLFNHFCHTRRDALHHLSIAEQSKELAAIYHKLTKDEKNDLEENYKQMIEDYVSSYTHYYQSLSEKEKSNEKSPEEALTAYHKILQKIQRKRKKKQTKDNLTDTDGKKHNSADVLSETDISDSDDLLLSQEEVTSVKRKSQLNEDLVIPHKKKKKSQQDIASPVPHKKQKHDIVSPSTKMSEHKTVNDADDLLLGMWSPVKTDPSQPVEEAIISDLQATKSKSHKKSKKSKI